MPPDVKYQFEADSPELKEFVKDLKWIDSINEEGDGDREHYDAIYEHKDGRLFQVECYRNTGIYSKQQFCLYRKDFIKHNPYVVTFEEVQKEVRLVEEVFYTHIR